jgi:8-oxo-dGTP diphosphatase
VTEQRGRHARAAVFLVRHAEAGIRTDHPDDHLRPLTVAGRIQANSIARLFESAQVGEILSSPYVRCLETLEPLAHRRGCSVLSTDVLAEGAAIGPALRLIAQVPERSVLCTHGDILRAVAGHVTFDQNTGGDADRHAKGVVWVVAREADRLLVVEVIPAPICRLVGDENPQSPAVVRASSSESETCTAVGAAR